VRRSAHSLKGSSSNIGAAALASLCGHLEELARDRCLSEVPRALMQVQRVLTEVREAVTALSG
jgi:HPt (histidine-containing phosphotransfer) domain-containing protein